METHKPAYQLEDDEMIMLDEITWTKIVVSTFLLVCLYIFSLSFLLLPVRGGEEGKGERLRSWHGHILTAADIERNEEYLDEIRENR